MVMRESSILLKVLLFINNPSMRMPSLLPLWIEPARVGNNYTDYVKVSFRRR